MSRKRATITPRDEMTPEEDKAFSFDEKESPYVFLQWKGTDACFDFHCKCGAHCHFDGYFAYYVKCPHCARIYQMPCNLFPREVSTASEFHAAKLMEPDEDLPTPPENS